MTDNRPAKKSRSGLVILFIAFLVVGVAVLWIAAAFLLGADEDMSLSDLFGLRGKVGVIPIEGTIGSSDELLKQLRKFRKDSSIKAIVLRINSPGGAVAPAQELYRELEKVRKKKPVVASIETVGASAAYYIASATNQIFCSKGSITGSIGVIMMLAQVTDMMKKVGIDVRVIKAGKYKDIGSVVRPLTEEEKEILETFAKDIHEQFIQDVAKGRKGKIEIDKLREIANGSFFTGGKAQELGLVDSMGNLFDAARQAAKLAGMKGEPKLVYPEKKWSGVLDMFMGRVGTLLRGTFDRSQMVQPAPTLY